MGKDGPGRSCMWLFQRYGGRGRVIWVWQELFALVKGTVVVSKVWQDLFALVKGTVVVSKVWQDLGLAGACRSCLHPSKAIWARMHISKMRLDCGSSLIRMTHVAGFFNVGTSENLEVTCNHMRIIRHSEYLGSVWCNTYSGSCTNENSRSQSR